MRLTETLLIQLLLLLNLDWVQIGKRWLKGVSSMNISEEQVNQTNTLRMGGECYIGAHSGYLLHMMDGYSCYLKVNDLDEYKWLQELTADRILTLVKHPHKEFDNDTVDITYITETPLMLPGRVLIIFGRIRNTEENIGSITVFLTNPGKRENIVRLSANWGDEQYFSQLSFLWHILIFADHIKWYSNLRHIGDFRLEVSTENLNQIIISGNLRIDVVEMGFLPQVADVFEAEEICYDFNGGHLWSPESIEEYNTVNDLFKPERISVAKKIQEELIGARTVKDRLINFDGKTTAFIESKIADRTVEYGDCFSILRWNDNGTIQDEIITRECHKAVVSFICKVSMTQTEYEIMTRNAIEKGMREIDEQTRIREEVRRERKRIPGKRHWTGTVSLPFDAATTHMQGLIYVTITLLFVSLSVILGCFVLHKVSNTKKLRDDKLLQL